MKDYDVRNSVFTIKKKIKTQSHTETETAKRWEKVEQN